MAQKILWTVTSLFIYHIICEKGGYSEQKEDDHKPKIPCKGNTGIYFYGVCNQQGDIIALFWGSCCFLSLRHTL